MRQVLCQFGLSILSHVTDACCLGLRLGRSGSVPFCSGLVWSWSSCPVLSCLVLSCPGPVWSGLCRPVPSRPVLSCPVLSCSVLSSLVLSGLVLSEQSRLVLTLVFGLSLSDGQPFLARSKED